MGASGRPKGRETGRHDGDGMNPIANILKELMTSDDNVTWDVFRSLAVASIVVAFFLEGYSVIWQGKTFDMQAFGIGVGSLLGGVGVALRLNKDETK